MVLAMKDIKKSRGKMLQSSEGEKEDVLWRFHDEVYALMIPDLRHRIAEQHHDSKIRGHEVCWKTLELILRSYGWLNMSQYI